MDISALQILALALCATAVAGCFAPRVPAALISYGAMICAHCSGGTAIHTEQLVFWGIASGIVFALRFMLPEGSSGRRSALAYTAAGAACGAFVGILVSPSSAGAIIGAAAGVFFGAVAYMRKPASPRYAVASADFAAFLAAKGLPAIVTMSTVAITTVSVLAVVTASAA